MISFSAPLLGSIIEFCKSRGVYETRTADEWAVMCRQWIAKRKPLP